MKQKIIEFKKQIRKQQIQTLFADTRRHLQQQEQQDYQNQQNSNKQNTLVFPMHSQNRRRSQRDSQSIDIEEWNGQAASEEEFREKWAVWDNQFIAMADNQDYQAIVRLTTSIYHDLKKVSLQKAPQLQHRKAALFDYFLSLRIVINLVNCLAHSRQANLNPGLQQNLSVKAVNILEICIYNQPGPFSEQVFLSSNLLDFLACAINEPKYDFGHISKILDIMVHMIVVSVNRKRQLFGVLNTKTSVFHFGAIFYNLCKMPMKPKDNITEHFVMFMKHYLQEIEDSVLKATQSVHPHSLHAEKVKEARSITILTVEQLEITFEVSSRYINDVSERYYESQEQMHYLQEALGVIKVILELFPVKQKLRYQLQYRRLVDLLSIKSCSVEIKERILLIVDHLLYADEKGDISYHLVKECDLIDRLWGLREKSYSYVMNIFCNLALDQNFKSELSSYLHRIFINLKYNKSDKFLYTLAYNWFHSQDFEIRTSLEKLILMQLRESEETDEKIIGYECMLWCRLVEKNDIEVPPRILNMDNQYSVGLREALNMPLYDEPI